MWIVKLAGSLQNDPLLPHWLELLATVGRGRVVIVPGGGPFAGSVRLAQERWRLRDTAALGMKVLAMMQAAMLMDSLQPGLQAANEEADILRVIRSGRTALWTPLHLLRERPQELTISPLTANAAALWLARRLNAERLILVNHCGTGETRSLSRLIDAGMLDACFSAMVHGAGCAIEVMDPTDLDRFRRLLTRADCTNTS